MHVKKTRSTTKGILYHTKAVEQELQRAIAQSAPLLLRSAQQIIRKVAADFPARLSERNFANLEQHVITAISTSASRLSKSLRSVELYPMATNAQAVDYFIKRLNDDLYAACRRIRLKHSLTAEEKIAALHGMLRTRHLDARLKKLFITSEAKLPNGTGFQGKGFRSMGQEAIYAAGLRLKRGKDYLVNGEYRGDYVAPMIRDLGMALAMGQQPVDVMAAQLGKVGKPTHGKDLHIGDFNCGILPPAAPITISCGSACGIGFALKGSGRVILNCIGEGGTSAGEWHEVVNFAAVQNLPIVFIVQNNQTALSTPIHEQSAVFNFAQKAVGYGIRGYTLDGTDAEAIFAAVTEAAETCRAGNGPVLLEMVCMRMCGHAHHDDMLYFGTEPQQFLDYVNAPDGGYVDKEKYTYWYAKDPIAQYREQLLQQRVITAARYEQLVAETRAEIEAATQAVLAALWPDEALAGHPVVFEGPWLAHSEPLADRRFVYPAAPWSRAEPAGVQFDSSGKTFWQAIAEALAEEMRRDPATFIIGEDVGGSYGNAFLILKSLLEEFSDRIINTPLAEAAIIGCATGAALLGKRPIAEIQFNDFIASGFNQLVNNTAKIFYRWGHSVPLTVRLPWGGLRSAGPYHSQNTEPWFYRTPGLKIVCPATPVEAKGLLKAAIRDDNPVLFLEHIALYRAAAIKQALPPAADDHLIPIGQAHLKREGSDLTIITYGAYLHRCLAAATQLEAEGLSCQVLDLRSLLPLDHEAILACVRQTGKVMIVHEDSKTGGLGQSIAAIIAEQAFEYLEAPVRVLGALDTPVPYSPPLEERFLVSNEQIVAAARLLSAF